MLTGQTLFEVLKARHLCRERPKTVVRIDPLNEEEQFVFRGLLSDNGYRFTKGTVRGVPALLIWVSD